MCRPRRTPPTRRSPLRVLLAVSLMLISVTACQPDVPSSRPAVALFRAGTSGYWIVTDDGGVFTFGDGTPFYGSVGTLSDETVVLNKPAVGGAPTPSGKGYWLVASDGGVFTFGDARFYGSAGGSALQAPVVGMAATPTGKGYWLVASDGGVFSYGDAKFFGSLGGVRLSTPIVGIATTPKGNGYWLAAQDGGVFTFPANGAGPQFYGSAGGTKLSAPIAGIAASPGGDGYWLVGRDGGVFGYGNAPFHGSLPGLGINRNDVVGMTVSPGGSGYWLISSDGTVSNFGTAKALGRTIYVAPPPPQSAPGLIEPHNVVPTADGYVRMPDPGSNDPWVFSNGAAYRCGSRDLTRVLYTVAQRWHAANGGYLSIGDLNGPNPPHASHNHGVDVDVNAFANGLRAADTMHGNFSSSLTVDLGKQFISTGLVSKIFWNDAPTRDAINSWARANGYGSPVEYWAGHDNHFHVRITSGYGPERRIC